MGMPCEVNSILKLSPQQGYPAMLELGRTYQVQKDKYRIFPIDVPLPLVDQNWVAHADIVIRQLVWERKQTHLTFEITRIYSTPFLTKG